MSGGGGGSPSSSGVQVQQSEPWSKIQPYLLQLALQEMLLSRGKIPNLTLPNVYDPRTGQFLPPQGRLGSLKNFNIPDVQSGTRMVGKTPLATSDLMAFPQGKSPGKGLADMSDFIRSIFGDQVPIMGQLGPGRTAYPISPSSYFVSGPIYNQPDILGKK
jgi:hypothetical protein